MIESGIINQFSYYDPLHPCYKYLLEVPGLNSISGLCPKRPQHDLRIKTKERTECSKAPRPKMRNVNYKSFYDENVFKMGAAVPEVGASRGRVPAKPAPTRCRPLPPGGAASAMVPEQGVKNDRSRARSPAYWTAIPRLFMRNRLVVTHLLYMVRVNVNEYACSRALRKTITAGCINEQIF